jgi:hypothetical protein
VRQRQARRDETKPEIAAADLCQFTYLISDRERKIEMVLRCRPPRTESTVDMSNR